MKWGRLAPNWPIGTNWSDLTMRLSNLADYAVVAMCAASRHCGGGKTSAAELAAETGRGATKLHRCVYTTLNINEDAAQADKEWRAFVEGYYGAPFETASRTQSVCAGNAQKCASWLRSFIEAGAETIVIRFGGPDQQGQLQKCARDVLPEVLAKVK